MEDLDLFVDCFQLAPFPDRDRAVRDPSGDTSARAHEPAPRTGPCATSISSSRITKLILNVAAPMAYAPSGPAPPLRSGPDDCTDDGEAPC